MFDTTCATAFIAGSVVAFFTLVIWNCEPPRNSMLNLIPPIRGITMDATVTIDAMMYHSFRPPTKPIERAPGQRSLPHFVRRFAIPGPSPRSRYSARRPVLYALRSFGDEQLLSGSWRA